MNDGLMRPLMFVHGRAILADELLEDATIVCREGRIESVRAKQGRIPKDAEVIDLQGAYVCPGFVDIHVHGGAGADFMDGTAEAVRTVCQAHARHGTTTLFPTTTTGSVAQIQAMLKACAEVTATWSPEAGARPAGVHLYGPFFAEDKVGCHSVEGRRSPTPAEYRGYFQTGQIGIATCAAELPGAAAFYRAARKQGCFITCGHSNASWTEMERAFREGMRHVDHFWCAMSNVASVRNRLGTPMQGSMLEYVLGNPEMSTEVIADGCHLAPELLEFAWRMKGADRLCLVTDCNRALDMPEGRYRFGSLKDGSWFESDGQVGWAPGRKSLASSIRGMDHMVRQMKRSTRATLPEVVRMASLTPAMRTGIADEVGSLEPGKRADLLVLNARLEIKRVYLNGEPFPRTARNCR